MRTAPLSPGLSSLWATVWQPLHQSWLPARESPSQWMPPKGALDRQTNGWTDRCMHRAVVVVLTPQEGRLGNSVHNAWYKMPLGQARSLPSRTGGRREAASVVLGQPWAGPHGAHVCTAPTGQEALPGQRVLPNLLPFRPSLRSRARHPARIPTFCLSPLYHLAPCLPSPMYLDNCLILKTKFILFFT